MTRASTDTLWRQWNLLRLIPRAPRRTTVAEICEGLERQGFVIGRRTVERDLHNLSARFPLIADESARPFGWSWTREANFEFAPRLSTSQGIALLLAQSHLRTLLPAQVQNDLFPLFDLARTELANGVWKDWHRRTAVIPGSLLLLAPDLDTRVLEDVHRALAMRRLLRVTYRSKGARKGRCAVVHPLGLIVRGQVHYLACTFDGYHDVRQLALHRLSKTEVANEPSIIPADFDFGRYARSSGSYEAEGMIQLVARFTPKAAEHLHETPLSADQTLRELPDSERIEVTASVPLDQPLRWWLRAFGSQVEVVSPSSLRKEMLEDVRASEAVYAGLERRSAVG